MFFHKVWTLTGRKGKYTGILFKILVCIVTTLRNLKKNLTSSTLSVVKTVFTYKMIAQNKFQYYLQVQPTATM